MGKEDKVTEHQLRPTGTYIIIVLIFLLSADARAVQAEDPQLIQLRHQLAVDYLEPAPHMAIAKYLWGKDNRLQAFYLLEYARRGRFPEAEFDRAFKRSFAEAKPRNQAKLGESSFNRGIALQNEGKLDEAEEHFVKAAALSPNSVHIQSWVGRFFFKVRGDHQRALHYYLNAYFLDPHAYETEFVESRIRTINYEAATNRYRQLVQSRVPLEKLLTDANPTVVVRALEDISALFQPADLIPLVDAMGHDDEEVRWLATEAIKKNVDRSFDERLRALLKDSDLRKRGLAAYLALHLWKEDSFDFLRNMLREDAQLLRFDAISALALEGSEGARQILLQHRQRETHPILKKLTYTAPPPRP